MVAQPLPVGLRDHLAVFQVAIPITARGRTVGAMTFISRFQSQLETVDLERGAATAIFRACQEALTNVARHSGASLVEAQITATPGGLLVVIRDNGRGISTAQAGGA